MSIGSGKTPFAQGVHDAPLESVPEPTMEDIQRRERRLVVALGGIVAVIALVGWLTIPSEASLLKQASEATSHKARIEAINTLVHRGYWNDRPPAELRVYVSQQPKEVQQFMQEMNYRLLSR